MTHPRSPFLCVAKSIRSAFLRRTKRDFSRLGGDYSRRSILDASFPEGSPLRDVQVSLGGEVADIAALLYAPSPRRRAGPTGSHQRKDDPVLALAYKRKTKRVARGSMHEIARAAASGVRPQRNVLLAR
jgi:hypothetical protein